MLRPPSPALTPPPAPVPAPSPPVVPQAIPANRVPAHVLPNMHRVPCTCAFNFCFLHKCHCAARLCLTSLAPSVTGEPPFYHVSIWPATCVCLLSLRRTPVSPALLQTRLAPDPDPGPCRKPSPAPGRWGADPVPETRGLVVQMDARVCPGKLSRGDSPSGGPDPTPLWAPLSPEETSSLLVLSCPCDPT